MFYYKQLLPILLANNNKRRNNIDLIIFIVHFFQLVYYRGNPPTVKDLRIPGCDILCPFDKYLDLIEDLIPSDEEMICDKRQTPSYAGVEYPAGLQNMLENLIQRAAVEKNIQR